MDEYAVYTSYVKAHAARMARQTWETYKTDSPYGWYEIARSVFGIWHLDCLEKSDGWDIHWTAGNIATLRQVFIDAYVAEIALMVDSNDGQPSGM